MCVSARRNPIPPSQSCELVHVANVQVDYADKGKKGHVILAMSSCVADFAEQATGPYRKMGLSLVNLKAEKHILNSNPVVQNQTACGDHMAKLFFLLPAGKKVSDTHHHVSYLFKRRGGKIPLLVGLLYFASWHGTAAKEFPTKRGKEWVFMLPSFLFATDHFFGGC